MGVVRNMMPLHQVWVGSSKVVCRYLSRHAYEGFFRPADGVDSLLKQLG